MEENKEGALTMLNRGVISSGNMQNLTPGHLLPHNERYYQQCMENIESLTELEMGIPEISKEEISKLVLLHIRETQLDGLRAEQRLGTDPARFVQELIQERKKLLFRNILKDKFQFPLYAGSLYFIGYAFFAFLLAAWHEYELADAFIIPIPFSAVGLFLGAAFLTIAFLVLFYRGQKARLLCEMPDQHYRREEFLNYLAIGASFLIPYLLLRMRIMLFHLDLWQVFAIGLAGVLLARRIFIKTDTLPI